MERGFQQETLGSAGQKMQTAGVNKENQINVIRYESISCLLL